MPTFYLIRHGSNDFVGKRIAGWLPDVHLNAEGRAQAGRLAHRLAGCGITRLYTSPLERARETAEPIGEALGLDAVVRENLGEVRYGEWTGKTIRELEDDPRWQLYNTYRSATRPPGGETMLDCQQRILAELGCLARMHPGETVAVVSHGDIIRAALLYWLGMAIDLVQRLEVRVASVSVARVEDTSVVVKGIGWDD